jgi:hypothetical protein
MPNRFEEEPDDPDEAPAAEEGVSAPAVPKVASSDRREYEFQTIQLSPSEMNDGTTLAERLTASSQDGWDLADIVPSKDQFTILLRRPRKVERESRPVGFMAPKG